MTSESRVRKSYEIYQEAAELIPSRTQLRSRLPSGQAEGVSPVYAESAKGSRFIDVDGNEYIDWVNAVSAVILGHADDVVNAAVKEQVDKGSIYSVNSPLEIELARELVNTIPSAEMVRYSKGGGDACAVAVRIARTTTGRDKIIFSGYHGWHDWYQSAQHLDDPKLASGVEAAGVPKAFAGTAIPFEEGDLDRLKRLLKENQGEVAAVMMEPLRSTIPPDGYLEEIKELAHANGAFLIFDEVSCGWRISLGGAQEYLGVTPDMSVFAKSMSNGYPMGAVVGSREAMAPSEKAFISSSYWSDNVGLAASLATIRELRRRDSTARFKQIGEDLRVALEHAIESVGVPVRVTGLHTRPTLQFDVPDGTLRGKVETLFVQEMALRGIHCYTGFMATLAHTQEDIRITADAAAESFKVVMAGLEGDVDGLLKTRPSQVPFRRLVR